MIRTGTCVRVKDRVDSPRCLPFHLYACGACYPLGDVCVGGGVICDPRKADFRISGCRRDRRLCGHKFHAATARFFFVLHTPLPLPPLSLSLLVQVFGLNFTEVDIRRTSEVTLRTEQNRTGVKSRFVSKHVYEILATSDSLMRAITTSRLCCRTRGAFLSSYASSYIVFSGLVSAECRRAAAAAGGQHVDCLQSHILRE